MRKQVIEIEKSIRKQVIEIEKSMSKQTQEIDKRIEGIDLRITEQAKENEEGMRKQA